MKIKQQNVLFKHNVTVAIGGERLEELNDERMLEQCADLDLRRQVTTAVGQLLAFAYVDDLHCVLLTSTFVHSSMHCAVGTSGKCLGLGKEQNAL